MKNLPYWLEGPYQVTLDGNGSFQVASHTHPAVAVSPRRIIDDSMLAYDEDGYLQFCSGVDCGTHHQSTAKLLSMSTRMADVLAQWASAAATADEEEMQNAISERDAILSALIEDES